MEAAHDGQQDGVGKDAGMHLGKGGHAGSGGGARLRRTRRGRGIGRKSGCGSARRDWLEAKDVLRLELRSERPEVGSKTEEEEEEEESV